MLEVCGWGKCDSDFLTNECFTHRLDAEHILLTTRHRAWVILDPQEYELFLRHRLAEKPELYALS